MVPVYCRRSCNTLKTTKARIFAIILGILIKMTWSCTILPKMTIMHVILIHTCRLHDVHVTVQMNKMHHAN